MTPPTRMAYGATVAPPAANTYCHGLVAVDWIGRGGELGDPDAVIPEPASLWEDKGHRSAGSREYGFTMETMAARLARRSHPSGRLELAGLDPAGRKRAAYQRFLKDYPGTVVAVTHDRYFLDNVAGWILELDRGHGIPWEGNYSSWLEQKEKRLEQEEKTESARMKAMKAELEWVRSNPKGRQAKSKARLQRFDELSSQEHQGRNETREIFIPPGPRLGDLVIEASQLKKGFGDKLLIDDLSFKLPRNGIVGVIAVPLNYFSIDLFGGTSMHPENLERGRLGSGLRRAFAAGALRNRSRNPSAPNMFSSSCLTGSVSIEPMIFSTSP